MQWTGLNELREKYLSFFESKEHLRLPSFSLIPQNDKSLLLINAGMAPMKKYFTGEATPPRRRVTTCQKCIRTPDIERVGKTARHGTYFEMLGNFSFGDYFKNEATAWAWEFCTKVLELPIDKLWVTIYEKDDEAFEIWTKNVGVDPTRIVRLGKEDNFWEHGACPCGPCSEIYFDRGEKYGCHSENCSVGCDCDRYVEFWNLVFTQFNSDGKGNYTPLQHPNIDTGMGLERLACIMQGVDNLFEVDTVAKIMKHISSLIGVNYKQNDKIDVSLRVITDHIRSTTFMIGDGVLPSNEGRGYVLRRLLRRAARHGRLLGLKEDFLYKVVDTVINENEGQYPELREKKDYIIKVVRTEEERFRTTIDSGLEILEDMIKKSRENGLDILSGEDAFKLYDTYGFPIDLTLEIIDEHGMKVDCKSFDEMMLNQRDRARKARASAGGIGWTVGEIPMLDSGKTEFLGYNTMSSDAIVKMIIVDNEAQGCAEESDNVIILLDKTPFYGESGGQVGDIGKIEGKDGLIINVMDTHKTKDGQFLHICKVVAGKVSIEDSVSALVDVERRMAIMRAHSSTHLLQKAIQEVLGNHCVQAGSFVEPDKLRFDFTHFEAISHDDLKVIEQKVNRNILAGYEINIKEMPITEAKKLGAMALFGEKYGDVVRVVDMGGYSVEFCGGTHLNNTSKAGLLKIISETSVAAGFRRIEAVTGEGVMNFLNEKNNLVNSIAANLKSTPIELSAKIVQLISETKEDNQKIESLEAKIAGFEVVKLLDLSREVNGVKVISVRLQDNLAPDILRLMGDIIKDKASDTIAVLATFSNDKINFVAVSGADALKKGAHAGNVIKEVAKLTGGGGGGRPDSATAGGKDVSKLDSALEKVYDIVQTQIKL